MTLRSYKRLTIILLIITVLALLLSGVMIAAGRGSRRASTEPEAPPGEAATVYYTPKPASSQENSETEETGYLITVYRGGIGVFQPGKTVPVLTKHTEVYLLPEEDIELLKKGIWARDLAEAKSVLEDYD